MGAADVNIDMFIYLIVFQKIFYYFNLPIIISLQKTKYNINPLGLDCLDIYHGILKGFYTVAKVA